jgi:hypothetical protein
MFLDSLGTPHNDIEFSGICVYIDIRAAYLMPVVSLVYLYLDVSGTR